MEPKLLIYTRKITSRIEYIFDFIFRNFSGIYFSIITDKQEFEYSNHPKINFSNQLIDEEINFNVDEILLENDIKVTTNYHSLNPIGKCFYWLSRYEEYIAQPNQFDEHQRFLGSAIDYSQPIVDLICIEIQNQIKEKYPTLQFKRREFKQINTHDVDYAWKYLHHSPIIKYGSLAKKIAKGDFKNLKHQINVLTQQEKDPYDTFDYYRSLAEKHQIETIFFWLLGDYSRFDKNHSHQNKMQIELIRSVSEWAKIGIHPSYQSNSSENQLKKEIHRLNQILNRATESSRHHFIKLSFPHTYQQLLTNGIKEDFTMGFAHKIGFRAGTATPFTWFDLSTNQQSPLTIYPFVAMDVTLKNYLNLTPEKAIEELKDLKEKTKHVNGTFITLFHQSNLNEDWTEWKKVYESIFK